MKIHGECLADSREGELPSLTLATFEIRFNRSVPANSLAQATV